MKFETEVALVVGLSLFAWWGVGKAYKPMRDWFVPSDLPKPQTVTTTGAPPPPDQPRDPDEPVNWDLVRAIRRQNIDAQLTRIYPRDVEGEFLKNERTRRYFDTDQAVLEYQQRKDVKRRADVLRAQQEARQTGFTLSDEDMPELVGGPLTEAQFLEGPDQRGRMDGGSLSEAQRLGDAFRNH